MDHARDGERDDDAIIDCVSVRLFIEVDLLVARKRMCFLERLDSIAYARQMKGCCERLIAKPPITNNTIFDYHNWSLHVNNALNYVRLHGRQQDAHMWMS